MFARGWHKQQMFFLKTDFLLKFKSKRRVSVKEEQEIILNM